METSQEDWLKERRAAWRRRVSGCAGTDGTLNGRGGAVRAGQAGATWLEETDEDWVLDTVVTASSSPNGFFPQHTVVIMQFLNWGGGREMANMKFKTEDSNLSTFFSWVI